MITQQIEKVKEREIRIRASLSNATKPSENESGMSCCWSPTGGLTPYDFAGCFGMPEALPRYESLPNCATV